MKKWMDRMAIRAILKLRQWEEDEEGMEIIQVLILLALGVGLVAMFIGFSDKITKTVGDQMTEFMGKFNGFNPAAAVGSSK